MLTARRCIEGARTAALLLIIVAVWCVVHNRLSVRNWQVPLFTASDALGMLAGGKAAAEGHFPLVLPKFNPHLGAPYVANWNDWPIVEEPLFVLSGLFARCLGLFAGLNLMVLLGQVLAGISFYLVCRWLRYRWEWAFAGSLAFALSHYAFQRSLAHLVLTYYWHVPLCLLVVWWCGSRRGLQLRGGRFWFSVVVALVTSVQSPYYTHVFLQFLGLAAVAQLFRRGNWKKIVAPGALAAVTAAGFVLMNVDTIYYQRVHGKNVEPTYRSYQNLEVFALKPIDLLIPPPDHRSSAAKAIASRYLYDESYKTSIPGEAFSPYLGLVGIAAIGSLAFTSIRRVAAFPSYPLSVHAVQVIWLLLFSVIGGVNGILGQFGLTAFRCTNRFSIVILALALLFAVRELTRFTRSWRPSLVLAGAISVVPLIFWDQLPPRQSHSAIARAEAMVRADRAFTLAMEKALPRNAMVFQLPVMRFPESWPIHQMGDYEHLRPYLYSSTLHYSYGSNKGRRESDWQSAVEREPADKLTLAVERAGFAAIYINRKGYADHGAALISSLQSLGYNTVIESPAHDLLCVLLKPSATPSLPAPPPQFTTGWYGEEGDPKGERWQCSSGDGEILLHNDSGREEAVHISFQLASHSPRTARLLVDGRLVYESPSLSPEKVSHFFSFWLQPGTTKLSFTTDPPVRFPGNPDRRLLGFILYNFQVTKAEPADVPSKN